MKTAALYFSKRITRGNTVVMHQGKPIGFLRTEVFEGKDISEALDAAKPKPGETVLNSVEILD